MIQELKLMLFTTRLLILLATFGSFMQCFLLICVEGKQSAFASIIAFFSI